MAATVVAPAPRVLDAVRVIDRHELDRDTRIARVVGDLSAGFVNFAPHFGCRVARMHGHFVVPQRDVQREPAARSEEHQAQ